MNEFVEYIKFKNEDNKQEISATSELLEYLYFEYIRHPFRMLRCSEEYKIAQDLITLQKIVNTDKPNRVGKLRTEYVKNLIKKYKLNGPLEQIDIKTIEENIIKKNRHFITAAFIADIVAREAKKEYWRWVVASLLAILGVLASYEWLFKVK